MPRVPSETAVCLDEATLQALALGQLPTEVFETAAAHIDACSACAARFAECEGAPDDLTARLRRGGSELMTGELVGEYELEALIGQGGMGRVWRARHRRMDRIVAIKWIAGSSAHLSNRFAREVQVLAALSHPNLAVAYDAGEHQGQPYLVMEYLNGEDLSRRLERGPLPLVEALDVVRQAAAGLAYAHARGIIHRDIKPANLFRTLDGTVKILDLGIARRTEEVAAPIPAGTPSASCDTQVTTATTVMGTIDFAAPEQMQSAARAGAAADVYSLGCTLYALLTGTSPFARATVEASLKSHREDVPPPLKGLPQRIARLTAAMLAKDPAARPEIAAVAAALRPRNRTKAWLVAAAILAFAGLTVVVLTRELQPRDMEQSSPAATPASPAPSPRVPVTVTEPLSSEQAADIQKRNAENLGVPLTMETSLGGKLVLIPPGQVSRTKHILAKPLWVGLHEVTVSEFHKFVESARYMTEMQVRKSGMKWTRRDDGTYARMENRAWNYLTPAHGHPVLSKSPVVHVSWDDAVAYCKYLSERDGATYRLPTMAENEWFCRCGRFAGKYYGDTIEGYQQKEITSLNKVDAAAPVGLLKPNPWGLYDTLGNVCEWLADINPEVTHWRHASAGSFIDPPSEFGHPVNVGVRTGVLHVGFRVVREFTPP